MRVNKDTRSVFLPNIIAGIVGGGQMSDLIQASTFPRIAQMKTLREILENAKDTVYGKEHHFEEILLADSERELYSRYQKYNKPTEFEDYRPYINRMKDGEPNVLFSGKPVLYATTSGSTGEPKYVPISKRYLDNVYKKMTALWVYNFVRARRNVLSGKMLVVVGKRVEGHVADGTPYGSVSSYTRAHAPKIAREMYPVPELVYDIEDYAARNYVIMRFAIERNVTIVITPNPSTILELQNTVDHYLDDLIEDIGNGTISDKFQIPEGIRSALSAQIKPDPKRAFELRSLQSGFDKVLPRHYWPNLQLVSTWKCGNTQIYLKKMADFFPKDVFHQELGYFATECRFGLVMDSSNETTLMPHFHYYEFKRERDLKNPDAPFFQLYELKQGERYCPFVTTFSGFYRYNMNDIVQVSSPFINTPRVHMVQKVNGIVSITGEKLYEDQFIKAVDQAQESTGMKLCYYTGYVNLSKSRYDWYFEFSDRKMNQKKANEFAEVVDENLKKLNIEYESKRNSFRLKDPAVYLLQKDSFSKFKEYILNRNHRDASRFKPNVLVQNESNHAVIHNLRQNLFKENPRD